MIWREVFKWVFSQCLRFAHLWHNAGEKYFFEKVLYHESVNMLSLPYLYQEVFSFCSEDGSVIMKPCCFHHLIAVRNLSCLK